MRLIISILILPLSVFGVGLFVPPPQTQSLELYPSGIGGYNYDNSQILAGVDNGNGTFTAAPVLPTGFFGDMVKDLDPDSFAVINGVVYAKGVTGGGAAVVLNTNLASVFASFSFTNADRVIIGIVPSFINGRLQGIFADGDPPTMPQVQASLDGVTWSQGPFTEPCYVSLFCSQSVLRGLDSFATNLIVNGYVDPKNVGSTNDFGGKIVFVDMTSVTPRSVVNLGKAQQVAVAAVGDWSRRDAVSTVNLAGNTLRFNSTWSVTSSNQSLIFRAGGQDVLTLTAPVAAGTGPVIERITLTDFVRFEVSSASPPTVEWTAEIDPADWQPLANATNVLTGPVWVITAPPPAVTNAFFRAYNSGTNAINAKVHFNADVTP